MHLTSFHSLGTNKGAPRVFLEGRRLEQLGFLPGVSLSIEAKPNQLRIMPDTSGSRHVSRRRYAGSYRPVIDLNSIVSLGTLAQYPEIKVKGSHHLLSLVPSVRAASILRGGIARTTYRIIDVCSGGATLSDAFDNPRFKIVAGIEIESAFADEFSQKNPSAEIISGDFRYMRPEEIPEFDGLIAGVPCTSHSAANRKAKLSGKPELGDVGDLYIPILGLIAARMPSFVVLECVPSFGSSVAGLTIEQHLTRLGYSVTSSILDPLQDFGEPSNRKRWICVATIREGFTLPNPGQKFIGTIDDYLDPESPIQDSTDATRISKTIAGLRRHAARHADKGNGFGLTVLERSAKSIPTILKSYHKVNGSGVFVATPYGPRMLRPSEVCRIMGHTFETTDPTTIYQMSGQGVQTRVFREIANALASFLP